MDDNINNAQTDGAEAASEAAEAVGTDAGTDGSSENVGENGSEFSEGDTGKSEASAGGDRRERERAQNEENARRRREAERQRELKEAREQAILDALGGENPYTHESMKDSADVEEFLAMREIAKKGGDPLTDYAGFLKDRERDRVKKEQEEARKADWYRGDRAAFAEKHPEVDLGKLVADKQFALYADGKVGRLPLSDIYEGFLSVVGEYSSRAEKAAQRKAAQALANSKASPGALSGSGAPAKDFFSAEQVRAMSQEEVAKHYDKIRESMKKW